MRNSSIFRNIFLTFFTFALCLVVMTGCGYKPSSYYAKKEISGKVYVDLHVNLEDPKNSVLIKDAMNKLLITRLGSKLVKRNVFLRNFLVGFLPKNSTIGAKLSRYLTIRHGADEFKVTSLEMMKDVDLAIKQHAKNVSVIFLEQK